MPTETAWILNFTAAPDCCVSYKNAMSLIIKVKCTLVQALRLCTGRTARRGSRVIALSFLDHSTRRGWGVSVTPRPFFTPEKDPVPIVQGAGWASGLVWTGAENLAPHRHSIHGPSSPYSQSLYRLRYPAYVLIIGVLKTSADSTSKWLWQLVPRIKI